MYYSNPCHFGKTTNHQWSADPWCLTKSSFPLTKTFDILALTHTCMYVASEQSISIN